MKLSSKQAIMLLEILRATLSIANLSSYDSKTRLNLYNEIINQQDNKLVNLEQK